MVDFVLEADSLELVRFDHQLLAFEVGRVQYDRFRAFDLGFEVWNRKAALGPRQLPDRRTGARLRASRQVATASRSVARFLVGLERPGYLEPREAARWLDLVSGQRSRLREALAGSEAVEARCAEGFERDLGLEIATLQPLSGLLGAFSIAVHSELSVDSVAVVHERIGHFSCMDLLVERLASVQRSPGWEGVAAAHLLVEMLDFHRSLTRRTLERGLGEEALPHFLQENTSQLQVIAETVRGIADDARAGLAALTVLSQQIRRLC